MLYSDLMCLQSFSAYLLNPGEWTSKLNIQVRPVEPALEAGAQIQQMVNAECVDDYTGQFALFNAEHFRCS